MTKNLAHARRSMLAIALGGTCAFAAQAQDFTPMPELSAGFIKHQQRFGNDAQPVEMRNGYSAERLLDAEVRGGDGEALGSVENFLVDADGRISSIVVASQGFMGIGGTRLVVPWNEVKLAPQLDHVQVPVREDSLSNFNLFKDNEMRVPAGTSRGTQLMNDWISLANGMLFGYVEDVIFADDGTLRWVVVTPESRQGYGTYAYPYQAQEADRAYVGKPYVQPEVGELRLFDYAALGIDKQLAQGR